MMSSDIQDMRVLLPILKEIDDQTLLGLDRSEWYRPNAEDAYRLQIAADRLGVHLMSYRAGYRAESGRGLCNLIAAAPLSAVGISEVAHIEATFSDAVIVAYERPTRRRH